MSWLDALMPWRAARAEANPARWVVLDVESSGLDPRRDRLLALAAIAVRISDGRPAIDIADSFEVVLRQALGKTAPDRQNILLHGIGVGAQLQGVESRAALQAFAGYIAASPLIAFHAAFDRTLIERACRAQGLAAPGNGWLDLASLASVLQPQVKARSLDEWMQALDIRCAVRHQAAADTLATAELLLKLWPALLSELPKPDFKAVAGLAAQRRWLPA